MGNIAYFEVPADDLGRARKFYGSVFGWEIKNTPMPGAEDYTSITTGKAEKKKGMSTLNMGGMTKRMWPGQPVMNYVQVESVNSTLELVKQNGGKQTGETLQIPKVGTIAFINDSEGNAIGIWEPEKK